MNHPIRRSFSLLLCLLLFASSLVGCGNSSTAQEIWGRGDAKEIDITSKIPGRVVTLLVKEGDRVEQGQLLARIDNRDIAAKANQAQAGIQALEAQLSQAATVTSLQDQTLNSSVQSSQAMLGKADADLSLATKDYERFSKLALDGAISQQALDKYQAQLQVSQAARDQAAASLRAAEATLLQGRANRENEASLKGKVSQAQASLQEVNVTLDETEIRAPFSGIVTAKYVEQGAIVSTGMPLVALQDPLDNWVNLKVKETELGRYQIGQTLQLEGRDPGLKLEGKIIDVSKKAEFATYRATNERGDNDIITFNVKIQINSEKLRPGMRFRIVGSHV